MMLLFFSCFTPLGFAKPIYMCASSPPPALPPLLLATPCHQSVQQRAEEIIRRFALRMLLLLSLLRLRLLLQLLLLRVWGCRGGLLISTSQTMTRHQHTKDPNHLLHMTLNLWSSANARPRVRASASRRPCRHCRIK